MSRERDEAIIEAVIRECFKCGAMFKPSPSRLRKRTACHACEAARCRDYKRRRDSDPERREAFNAHMRAYSKIKFQRPEVRKASALRAKEKYANSPLERIRSSVRRKTRFAIERGELQREPCFMCGSSKSDAHHPDYSSPMAVTWLCRPHHNQLHREHRGFKI